MRRYSILWWSIIVPTSVAIGVPAFLVVRHFTDWDFIECFAVAAVATLLADLVIAISMEAVAPTRLHIGPGEKLLFAEHSNEQAKVISGFESSAEGYVSIRGETWRAIRASNNPDGAAKGTIVNVVERDGLTLIVSAQSSQAFRL